MRYSKYLAIFIMLLGLALIITTAFSPTAELKFAIALAGIALILSGLIQLRQAQDKNDEEERYRMLTEKLEKIEKDIASLEQTKGSGVAIADVISSGLKYYAEHIAELKKEDEND
jgi:membrane-bound ClpP family serine protease